MSSARPAAGAARRQVPAARRGAPRRPSRAMRRARRRGLARLAVLVVVIVLAVWLGVHVATASGSVAPVVYEARAGDTVWGIAARAYDAGVDLRRAVYEIERVNGVSAGSLQPGDELVLPPQSAL